MKKISYCFLFLLVCFVYAQKEKLPVISKAEQLKTVKAKKIIWQKDKSIMVAIPPSDTTEPFWMDTTEVTIGQFKKFLAESNHSFSWAKELLHGEKGDLWKDIYRMSPTDAHPLIYVTWHDAVAYAKWAGKRLSTEKEWEFAARGGLINKEYSWGDDESLARDYANYAGTGGKDKWPYTTAPVGSFKPNGYGLYDMAGNVIEWCQDLYDDNKFPFNRRRVLWGGAWTYDSTYLRLDGRSRYRQPDDRDLDGGFRCVLGSN